MAKSNLVSEIIKLSKQKMIPAICVDKLGDRCSVRLSSDGKLLRNLVYLGVAPAAGDTCFVDYATGSPIVYTSVDVYAMFAEYLASLKTTDTTQKGTPIEKAPIPNLKSYTWVIDTPAVGGIPGPRLTCNQVVIRIDYAIVGGTSVDLNVEERTDFEATGTDILASDVEVVETPAETISFAVSELLEDDWLWLDISEVVGAVTKLVVTIKVSV